MIRTRPGPFRAVGVGLLVAVVALLAGRCAEPPAYVPLRILDVSPVLLDDRDELREYVNAFPLADYEPYAVRGGLRFFVDDPGDMIKQVIVAGYPWERHLLELFERHVEPGTVVVEVGAHIGTHTVPIARLVGSLRACLRLRAAAQDISRAASQSRAQRDHQCRPAALRGRRRRDPDHRDEPRHRRERRGNRRRAGRRSGGAPRSRRLRLRAGVAAQDRRGRLRERGPRRGRRHDPAQSSGHRHRDSRRRGLRNGVRPTSGSGFMPPGTGSRRWAIR